MRILVSGYYGFGNLGDESVLAALLRQWRRRGGGDEFVVLSADPPGTARLHRVKAISRWSLPAILMEMQRCDVFVSGGGSLLQDATSVQSLVYYCGLIESAHVLGKRIVIYAQGLGPLRRTLSRVLAAQALSRAGVVTMRDEASIALARSIGVMQPIQLLPDPVLTLSLEGDRASSQVADRPHILVSLRPWSRWWSDAVLDDFAGALDRFSASANADIIFVAMKAPDDERLSNLLKERMQMTSSVRVLRDPDEALRTLSGASLVVGMRLHALIFAAAAGTPFVGLAYDPKVSAFAQSVEQPCVESPREIAEAMSTAWTSRSQLQTSLRARAAALRAAIAAGHQALLDALVRSQ